MFNFELFELRNNVDTAIKLKYMYYPGMCNMSTKTFLLVKS